MIKLGDKKNKMNAAVKKPAKKAVKSSGGKRNQKK